MPTVNRSGPGGSDISQAVKFLSMIDNLQFTMKTQHHVNSMMRGAFSILSDAFDMETATVAVNDRARLHHVYEPQQIGNPLMQLWRNELKGQGSNRTVTWEWRASKQLVDPLISPTGKDRFANAGPGFDGSKLQKIHIFVWKAPVMEYGLEVLVRPELSPRKLLVFPDPDMKGATDNASHIPGVVFTPHFYRFSPGKENGVVGNFTAWFSEWWGGGRAQEIIHDIFEKDRDSEFKRSFTSTLRSGGVGKATSKTMSMGLDTKAPSEGKRMAEIIAGDLERKYIAMAAKRRRGAGTGE
jgi:hypothetical protein